MSVRTWSSIRCTTWRCSNTRSALDQAAPLKQWDLPEAFATLRRLLEARLGPSNHGAAGKRDYVQVLRLLESFPPGEVEAAVREAVRSEERRVGKECVSTCRSRWSPSHYTKKQIDEHDKVYH